MSKKRKPNPIVNPMDYECHEDYIMLEPEQEAEITDGGIVIPEQARKYLNEGKILKKGPHVGEHLQKGMFVVFDSSSEYRLELAKGVVVFVVKESNVILYRNDITSKLFPAAPPQKLTMPPSMSSRK